MAEGDGAEVERRRPAAAKRRAEIENMRRESLTPTCCVHARCVKLRCGSACAERCCRRLQAACKGNGEGPEGGGVEILKQDFGISFLIFFGFRFSTVLLRSRPPPRFNKSLFQFRSCVVPPVDV